MGPAYPELVEHRDEIHRVLAAEEERFGVTLENGMEIFEQAAVKGEITAQDVFDLQTTYGFPPELTEELARERGLAFNDEEDTHLMEEHREVSRPRGGSAACRAPSSSATSRSTCAPPSRRTPTSATASSRSSSASPRSIRRAA